MNQSKRIRLYYSIVYSDIITSFEYFQDFLDFIRERNQGILPHFVYFNKEPPGNLHEMDYQINRKFYDAFDITYTYRRDAVITTAYGKIIPKEESTDNNELLQDKSIPIWKPFHSNLVPKSILQRDMRNKTKGILWMVSHCKTDSRREHYIAKLQTHLKTLSIDILGQCGKNVLPKDNFVGESLGKRNQVYLILSN